MENTSSTARRKGAWADKNRSSLCDYNHFIDFINVDVLEHGPIRQVVFISSPLYWDSMLSAEYSDGDAVMPVSQSCS